MSSREKGLVYLIGAGPGDPGLITVRGLQLLSSVDVVCTDALVDPALIALLPREIEVYYVGKRAGAHSVPQGEIEDLLVRLARQGKRVARLKGGDPYVFGRGGEEALALRRAGVPFQVVPGVTAAVAAGAHAGIPATHRGLSTFAVLLTAHENPGKGEEEAAVPWLEMARLTGGTIAGYMGVRNLPDVVKTLIEGGMDPATPAAVVERGTMSGQRTVRASLQELPEAVKTAGLKPPAVFMIGRTTELAGELSWRGEEPLAGLRVLVTRPAAQAARIYELLRGAGAEVVPAPSIETVSFQDEITWERLLNRPPQQQGWLVFTSENGVRFFLHDLQRHGRDLRWLGPFRIAVVGRGTLAALQELHLSADLVPEVFTGQALGEMLASEVVPGEQVVRVRGTLANDSVERALDGRGAEVVPLTVYETRTAPLRDVVRNWVDAGPLDFAVFTSGSTFKAFLEQWGEQASEHLAGTRIVSIGPVTSDVIRRAGYEVDLEAARHDVDGIVQALVRAQDYEQQS